MVKNKKKRNPYEPTLSVFASFVIAILALGACLAIIALV